ncbi:flagellar basal body P-ring protein FlgI [Chitinimonas lacunae]|uniref:Flagellar P-ring protein n=1 Tax=Chitinimonas lacunae TaxID=1963018 RepID=A0ABV8MU91_9NEIS
MGSRLLLLLGLLGSLLCQVAEAGVRVKDLGRLSGWRDNALVGYGLVTGLAGTGDSTGNKATRQSIANMLAQFGVTLTPEQVSSRNAAAVMVTASLPPFARPGDTIDVTVTSLGDARSLVGGSLLIVPLKAANNRVYALAQGPLSVGGYKYDMNGNVVQKNHPTVGAIPGGATVELGVENPQPTEKMTFVLANADYTTASRVAAAINGALGGGVAEPRDASAIEIKVPADYRKRPVDFVARLEKLQVDPDGRARVVINERTGTVVAGGDVRIDKVALAHGELKISIATDNSVSQPALVRQTGPEVRSMAVANSRIEVNEADGALFIGRDNNTVADLVQALARIKTNTRDIISILRAIKAAGALHADLVVQ